MPTIELPGPFKISFYSKDCDEPMHVHVKFQSASCKVWIGTSKTAQVKNLKPHQVRKIVALVKANEKLIKEVWNARCCKEKKK